MKMNLSKTQEILYGLEEFQNSLHQIRDQFHKMKEEFIKGIEELISFVNKWQQRILEEKIKQEKLSINLQFQLVSQNYQQFQEQLQKQLSKISNQIQKQISSIQISDGYFWLGQQCSEEVMNGSLVLKDDLMNQEDYCLAIAFNQFGTIMVSGCGDKIKVWDFNNGIITEITTLDPNQMQIFCLIFSKNSNSFLSGSTNSINMWYTKNDQSWENVNSIHNGGVYCMILNQKETELYTGGNQSISVWDINFENQNLVFKLNIQVQKPYSLSLNEQETFLVACCSDQYIHVWKIKLNTIELCQTINKYQKGYNLCFINNTQFIWLPAEQDEKNYISVYELQNGDFQEQEKKQIHLLQDDTCSDSYFFPIIFNKETKIIAVRHKVSVYLIQAFSNGTFKIITQKQFQTNDIYGTMTNDGKYLVLWNNCSMKYQIYEIQIQ